MLITPEYREMNRHMLATKNYGVSGHRWAERAHTLAVGMEARHLLDYGCGQGTFARALPLDRAYAVREYDPGIPGKDSAPEHADFVVCGDVLEHIEPDCLNDVIDDIWRLAMKAVFLVVATAPAQKHLPDGRNAHLIVGNSDFWLPKLISKWKQLHFEDFGVCFTFFGVPRNVKRAL